MNIAVRYCSRSGNTKKVAQAIAQAVQAEAKDCSAPLTEQTDLLFLGSAVYGFELDEAMQKYIEQLSPETVKAVALFGTSAIVKSGADKMRELLEKKGIPVLKDSFYCRGAFTVMHRGRPNAEDLGKAEAFARQILQGAQ